MLVIERNQRALLGGGDGGVDRVGAAQSVLPGQFRRPLGQQGVERHPPHEWKDGQSF